MKIEKGTKFKWPKDAPPTFYGVSDKGPTCRDVWHNGNSYMIYKVEGNLIYFEKAINPDYPYWVISIEEFKKVFPNTKINNMDLTKKGTLFTIPKKTLTYGNVCWGSLSFSKDTNRAGKQKVFGTKKIKGETWVLYDFPSYLGSDYWMSPLEELNLLLNIKNEEKTMTKITAAKAKTFPFSQLKTGRAFYSQQTGKGEIVIEGNSVYIVHNNVAYKGSRPMKANGFPYGWCLSSAYSPKVDLTYKGKFGDIQLGDVVEEQFKNSFLVKGTPALIKAFKEEALEAGWTFKGAATSAIYKSLYFCHKGDSVQSGAHFRLDGEACSKVFILPGQWDLAIKAMKEKEAKKEVKVEYIKFNKDGQEEDGLVKGRTYKVVRKLSENVYEVISDNGETIEAWEGEWSVGTKADFDSQKVYVGHIGGYKVNIQTVKIRGYHDMKVACIGCKDSEQVYTVGALETLRDVMKSKSLKKAENEGEGVEFTLEQVEALLEACE